MKRIERVVKVTRNFQVTIPAEVRNLLRIREGDFVTFLVEGDRVMLVPAKRRRLTYRAGFKVSVEEMERAVEEALDASTG